jgi:hypothetical protein
MSPLEFLNPGRWLLYGGLIATLVLGAWRLDVARQQIGFKKAEVIYKAKIEEQKTEARSLLSAETARVAKATKAMTDFKNFQETADAKNTAVVADLERRLRVNAGPAGRLRDPNATGCGGGGGSPKASNPAGPSNSAADSADAGGLFSVGATALLQRLTHEADEVNLAYISCRADALSVREAFKEPATRDQ